MTAAAPMVAQGAPTRISFKGTQARGIAEAEVRRQGRLKQTAKWPREVKTLTANHGGLVFEGRRALVLTDGRRIPIVWRSKKKVGFWVTCRDQRVYFGKTLAEATLRLAQVLEVL